MGLKKLETVYTQLLEGSQRMMIGEMRKFRIEQLRRIPEIQGYALWLMTDFPSDLEGFDWEQGLVNYFWEPKTVRPGEFSKFNSLNVVVSDTDISERTWWEGATATVGFHPSYYGSTEIQDAELSYQLVSEGKRAFEGKKSGVRLSAGGVTDLGDIEVPVPIVGQPAEYSLQVTLSGGTETIAQNDWSYWAYPRKLLEETTTHAVSRLAEKRVRNYYPVFTGSPHAYGSRIEEHANFRNFPNRGYFDVQCNNLVEDAFGLAPEADAMTEIDTLVRPLAWCVWSSGRTTSGLSKLGFLYEFRVGRGKVIVSTFNFRKYLDDAYASVVYLFDQVLRYAVSDEFRPGAAVSEFDFSFFLRTIHG